MKKIALILLSVAGLSRSKHCTANTLTEDVEALRTEMEALKAQNAELLEKLETAKTAASKPVESNELDLGGLELPSGLDKKDVIWRVRAGLDVKQAVQAAIAQKKHDEQQAAKKAAK